MKRENGITMCNPFDKTFCINDRTYSITQEAIEDFRAFSGNNLPPERIIEELVRKFPQKQHFNASDVEEYFKKA